MTNPYRAMCAELLCAMDEIAEYEIVDWAWVKTQPLKMAGQSMAEARALLAQSEPEGPSDEEARELADDLGITRGFFDHECGLHISCADLEPFARAVLARWGRPTPQPVAVSERLPGPEDCDEQGRCWLWERDCGYNGRKWALEDRAWSLSQSDEDISVYTHWLPANALPTPEATVHD